MSSIEELTSLTRAILFVNKDVGAVGRTTSTEDLQIVAGQSETTRMQQICSCRQFLLLNIHDKNWTVVNFEQVCSFSQSSIYFYDDCRLGYLKKNDNGKWQNILIANRQSSAVIFFMNNAGEVDDNFQTSLRWILLLTIVSRTLGYHDVLKCLTSL